MKFNYRERLPLEFAPDSRVWIYQSSRVFNPREVVQIEERLYAFASKWQSHGVSVKGYGILLFGQFIILLADESATGVSGCSTDSSVRLLKQMELDFDVSLFDRQSLAFIFEDTVRLMPISRLNEEGGIEWVKPETLYFNNMVQTKEELENHWIIPVKASWLSKQVSRFRPSLNL
jgi:hypothetical protein